MILQHPNMSIEPSLLFIFLTALFATHTSASSIPTEPTFFADVCYSAYGNYTTNSSYAADLKTVLTTLRQQSSNSFFYNTSAGSVYGQYYCRFDVDSALCSTCISQATSISTSCPNFKSAIIWYDVCSLRYRNESMFGVWDADWYAHVTSTNNVSDPESFYVTLNSTLTNLSRQAAYGNDIRTFGVAEVKGSAAFETTYFLVQCSPDLSAQDCETCLLFTNNFVKRCCGNWPVSASVYFPICQMRYSNLLFYTGLPSPPPPPPPLTYFPPPPTPLVTTSPGSTEGTNKSSSERVKVGLAVISLALLTFQL